MINYLFPSIQSLKLNVAKNKSESKFNTNNNLIEKINIADEKYGRNYPEILWWYDLDAPSFGSAATR